MHSLPGQLTKPLIELLRDDREIDFKGLKFELQGLYDNGQFLILASFEKALLDIIAIKGGYNHYSEQTLNELDKVIGLIRGNQGIDPGLP